MKKVIKLACLAMFGLMAIGMWAQEDANAPKQAQAAVPEVRASNPGGRSDYVIGPDDTLRISVWKEPDMSVNLPVRPDGKISMPLLDDVQAAGMTPMQLGASIREKLKKYIEDPRVTVVVTAMNSQRIYVLGRGNPHRGDASIARYDCAAGAVQCRLHPVCQPQSNLSVAGNRWEADQIAI